MLKINRDFSQSVLLIILDGTIKQMQLDKNRVLPCRFGASSPQAIGVTRKLP